MAEAVDLPPVPSPAEHDRLFLMELHPFASVYLGEDGMLGGEVRDRIAGFRRAAGAKPSGEADHLVELLALWVGLRSAAEGESEAERRLRDHAARALLVEHLVPWVFPFLERVVELGGPFHSAWARLLSDALLEELKGPATGRSLHLDAAPPLPDPREDGSEPFLQGLLAPLRSGIILARADLARAALQLDLGLRIGERRYQLRSLLGQDAPGTLRWMAEEALRQRALHQPWAAELELVGQFWRERAGRTATLLSELAAEAARAEEEAAEAEEQSAGADETRL